MGSKAGIQLFEVVRAEQFFMESKKPSKCEI